MEIFSNKKSTNVKLLLDLNLFRKIFITVFFSTFLFSCEKDSFQISSETLRSKSPSEQLNIATQLVTENGFISTDLFEALDYEVSRTIYKKMTNENKKSVWQNKIDWLKKSYESKANEIAFLEKLSEFVNEHFSFNPQTINAHNLEKVYFFEREAKKLFGSKYKEFFGTPQLSVNFSFNSTEVRLQKNGFIPLSQPKIPEEAACKCNVVSDYCGDGRHCFPPNHCNENSDWFCGFLLMKHVMVFV